MPRSRSQSLGKLEQRVLEFLWNASPATSDQVRSGIAKPRALSDSTIRTVLRRLETKGFIQHRVEGRQFLYSPTRGRRTIAAEAVQAILARFCRGSVEELLAGLVDHEVVDPSELRRLAGKIEAQRKQEEDRK